MPLFVVDTVLTYRIRYVVDCENAEHAGDTVTMEEAGEFSQLALGEQISDIREIDRDEYHRLFNKDNDYLQSWTDAQKERLIHRVNYEAI